MDLDAASSVEASFHRLLDGLVSLAVQGFGRDLRIFHWNTGSERLYGWAAEEVRGRRIDELLAPADQTASVSLEIERWISDGAATAEPREALLRHRDGSLRPVSYALVSLPREGGGMGYYCVDVDLRSREQAREEMDRLRERLQHVLEGTQDGVWDWDVVTDVAWFSPRFQALLGYRDEAAFREGFRFREALHPDDHGATTRMIDDHLHRGGPPFDAVYRLRRADGGWTWVHGRGRARFDAEGRPVRFSGAIADAEARVRGERALRDSEQRFRDLAALSSDWYWETDAEHRFTSLSVRPGHGPMLAPHDYLGRRRWDLPHEQMAPQAWEAHIAVLEQRLPFRDFEVRRPDGRGGIQVFFTSGLPRFDDQGRFLGYRGVGRDSTAEHQAAQEREALARQVRDTQKLEAVGTLAGGIAHDLNNMLGAILGNLALARPALDPGHPVTQRLDLIERSALHARNVVQQILAFGRRQPARMWRQPIQPLVEQSIELLRATVPANVDLRLRLPAEPVVANVDASQFHQVLMNLCINAWQALRSRPGWIEIRLEPLVLVEGYFGGAPVPGMAPGDWVHLQVRDNGCGIAEADLARIFDPFFTTKPADEGSGLGLSVVHGIVAGHGGVVGVDSRPGEGATFHVCLPAAPAAPAAVEAPTALPLGDLGQGRHVVLIDDDAVMGLVAGELLRHAGFRVTVHTDAAAALQQLQREPIDVVVTDLQMPEVSGIDLLRLARGLRRNLPVVVVSGNFGDARIDEARRAGAAGIVSKERVADDLVRVVGAAVASAPRA